MKSCINTVLSLILAITIVMIAGCSKNTNKKLEIEVDEKTVDDRLYEEIKAYVSVGIRDFTNEELELIESGKKTKPEIATQIISEIIETTEKTPDNILVRNISKIYEYVNDLKGRVTACETRARSFYSAYKKANPNVSTDEAKKITVETVAEDLNKIIESYYSNIEAQLNIFEEELNAQGAETSIVNTVRTVAYSKGEIMEIYADEVIKNLENTIYSEN